MDATLTIDGYSFSIDASMSWMLAYERAFREDALSATLVLLGQQESDQPALVINQIIAALLVNSGSTVEEAGEWLSILEIDYEQVVPALRSVVGSTYEKIEDSANQAVSGEPSKQVTFIQILAGGIMRGLTIADTSRLTLGMWLDFITAHNNLHSRSAEPAESAVRMATQADIDKLKR